MICCGFYEFLVKQDFPVFDLVKMSYLIRVSYLYVWQ